MEAELQAGLQLAVAVQLSPARFKVAGVQLQTTAKIFVYVAFAIVLLLSNQRYASGACPTHSDLNEEQQPAYLGAPCTPKADP